MSLLGRPEASQLVEILANRLGAIVSALPTEVAARSDRLFDLKSKQADVIEIIEI